MKLFIDNREADMDISADVSISLSVALVSSIEYGRTGYSKTITVPATGNNRAIMGDCEQINASDRFNASNHTARIEHQGFTIIDGVVHLTECILGSGGRYVFNVIGSVKEWAVSASAPFSTLGFDYCQTISASLIRSSWTDESTVKFLPVQRDSYAMTNSSVSIFPAARVLSSRDYHPFLRVADIVERIFAEAGYSVDSEFMGSPLFGSLYVSGNYPSRDASLLKARMDFMAVRLGESSATADRYGRVYADPNTHYNTVGNIVDTASAGDTDDNGNVAEGAFSNNDYFRLENGRVMFKPEEAVTVSFEYRIKYVTDYVIASRNELRGFNILNLHIGDRRVFKIINQFCDRRDTFKANRSYRAVVFGHLAGDTYRLVADEVVNPSADIDNLLPADLAQRTVAEFASRSVEVCYSQSSGIMRNLRLLCSQGGEYADYAGDWALYDGYVGETGRREVAVTVRSNPQLVRPSQPKYFDDFFFGGADEGMTLTIENGTSVRPVFIPQPAEGSVVSFADVASHDISRLTFINALRHMFNLCFYTNPATKTVCIEPRNGFYTDETIVDWSGRIDCSMPVTVSELGDDMPATMTFRYRAGDGASARYDVANGTVLGKWSANVDNVFADRRESVYENPLFRPSVSLDGCMPDAMSALLVQAGDRDAVGDSGTDDLNFPPKIVSYAGLSPLPAGECWEWPSYTAQYPLLSFHHLGGDDTEPFTLCFENRDGAEGLHRYWECNFDCYNRSKRLSAYIRLGAEDVERLIYPDSRKCDFRALYKLDIDGETCLYRLEEVCDYSPSAASTKCVFIKNVDF